MPISVTCPQCGKVLQARESAAGKRSTCPDCGNIVTIPELHEELLGFAEKTASELIANVDQDSGDDGERKRCPLCGEMIAKSAVKCRFCNEFLDPAMRTSQRSRAGTSTLNPANDDLTVIDWIIAVFCPCLACILGVVYLLQGKASGGKLIGVTFVIMILQGLIGGLISAVQQAMNMN